MQGKGEGADGSEGDASIIGKKKEKRKKKRHCRKGEKCLQGKTGLLLRS